MEFLGIDIGRTSIKSGLVSLNKEIKVSDFKTVLIPQISRTKEYYAVLVNLLQMPASYQAVGFGFPTVIWKNKIISRDIEFDKIWSKIQKILTDKKILSFAINDADAAGMAEIYRNQAVELRKGVTVILTLGTGIGSAVFQDGKLLPNTEMGTIEIHGIKAEQYAAPSIKIRESLSFQQWAGRLQEYLELVESLLYPNHLVLGGGISADFLKYKDLLKTRASLQPAYYRNQAGVVGTSIYAAYKIHYYDLIRKSDHEFS